MFSYLYEQGQTKFVDRYKQLIFLPQLAEMQCPSLSKEVIEIYRSLDLKQLAPEHLAVIIKFLFSTNGIFSDRVTVQELASHMFLKEYKANSDLFKPFSFDLLHLITG